MAYPIRSSTLSTWDIPPPPGAEEYHQPPVHPQPPAYIQPQTVYYTGLHSGHVYIPTTTNYPAVEKDSNTYNRYSSPVRAPGTSESRHSRRSESKSPSHSRHSSRHYVSRRNSRDRSPRDRYSRERDRYHSHYSSSRRRRSKSSSRYRRHRSRSGSRRRYRRSRSRSHGKYSRDRKSRSHSRSRSYSSRNRKHTRSKSASSTSSRSRSRSRSRSLPKSYKSHSPSSSPSKEEMIETTSRMSNTSQNSNPHRGLDRQSHKEFIKSKAQEYTSKQQSMLDKDLAFKNDGSFLEMFKKLQEKKEKETEQPVDTDKPEKILNIVAAASTLLEPQKPPTLPIVNKRRGGRVLKTGMVEKKKMVVQEEQPKDAWAVYMKEVKRYKEACCDDDSKTRPLVK